MVLSISALWSTVQDAIERRDLEGHLAVLVLNTTFQTSGSTVFPSPWTRAVTDLLAIDPIAAGTPHHASDIATLGIHLALGGAPDQTASYGDWARREIARTPLPPAACVRDDERLLLGVAAGIGSVASDAAAVLIPILRARTKVTLRQFCIDRWAEALAEGAPQLTLDIARHAYQYLANPVTMSTYDPITDEDRIVAFWLATRLFDAPWTPTDDQLRVLDEIITAGRRAARTALLSGRSIPPLDAAFIVDAFIASPVDRLARRSVLDSVLVVIDAFPKSMAVLGARKRSRPPFEITDEYDVQDLFFALVLPVVPDIVEEDPAPKVAGHSTRLDFTSKATRLGFEIKHVKSKAHAAKVREEILLDERTYQEHPYIDTVVAFVSDPNREIPLHERAAFEADLSQKVAVAGRSIRYIVRIR
jgi:REase_DpnII-MboI